MPTTSISSVQTAMTAIIMQRWIPASSDISHVQMDIIRGFLMMLLKIHSSTYPTPRITERKEIWLCREPGSIRGRWAKGVGAVRDIYAAIERVKLLRSYNLIPSYPPHSYPSLPPNVYIVEAFSRDTETIFENRLSQSPLVYRATQRHVSILVDTLSPGTSV